MVYLKKTSFTEKDQHPTNLIGWVTIVLKLFWKSLTGAVTIIGQKLYEFSYFIQSKYKNRREKIHELRSQWWAAGHPMMRPRGAGEDATRANPSGTMKVRWTSPNHISNQISSPRREEGNKSATRGSTSPIRRRHGCMGWASRKQNIPWSRLRPSLSCNDAFRRSCRGAAAELSPTACGSRCVACTHDATAYGHSSSARASPRHLLTFLSVG
jgi:hypothetical protein